LLNKHRVQSVEELIGLKSDIESRLTRADSAEEELNQCEDKIKALHKKVKEQAERLTSERLKAKSRFISSVSEEFSSLSLPNATIDLNISQSTDYHSFGIDDVNILFNANKGGTLEQLTKVASGGELSRLMLILKQKMAQSIGLPSLIFDEIDTGVSGEIAAQMAKSLLNLSEDRQVIAITHLPQVAGRAMHHLKISKSDTDERSITEVTELDSDGRILELAKMLSGSRISEASVANARELLKN